MASFVCLSIIPGESVFYTLSGATIPDDVAVTTSGANGPSVHVIS